MPGLYVFETGSRLEVEYERILVTLEDEVLFRTRLDQVSHVVLLGRVGMTTPAIHALLAREIPVFFLSSGGRLLGRLTGPSGLNVALRQFQHQRDADAEFSLHLARSIVTGKIWNQIQLACRWLRTNQKSLHPGLAELRRLQQSAETSPSLETLLGMEGAAAHAYFGIYRDLFDPAWSFRSRNRRPPRDPINALLSLGYTLLHCSLCAALEIVGLDPYLGYYHTEQYGRPALALDLEEEFRAPVVDSLVLNIVNHRILRPEHFTPQGDEPGTWLTGRGRRIFFHQFNRKLHSEISPPGINRAISYQKLFEVQARRIAHVIEGRELVYQPFRIR